MRRRRSRHSFRRRCLKASSGGVLRDVLDRGELRGAGRQEDWRDVVGRVKLARGVPSGPVEEQNRVGALGYAARHFVEVELHRLGVSIGQCQPRPDVAGRAGRAEQIGVVIALIGGLPGPRSAPTAELGRCGPRPQTRFRSASSRAVLRDEPSAHAESFLKSSMIRSS
jgi:hypothetical protein